MSVSLMYLLIAVVLVLFIVMLICMAKGRKYTRLAKASDNSLGELLVIGFGACELLGLKFKSEKVKKKIASYQVLYGEKYGEYYYRINLASQITIAFLVLILGLVLATVMRSVVIALLAVLAAGGMVYYYETLLTDKTTERRDSINADFSGMLSTLALLVNAGMILIEAWQRTSEMKDGTLYEEMRNTMNDINNGMSDSDAFVKFAKRCESDQVTKFISTLVQNMSKGNAELTLLLQEFSREAWTEKKEIARQKGEAASSKLLIPIALMFLGLLIMICLPLFTNMAI